MSQQFLKTWHQMVEARDPKILDALIADDVILRSPAYFSSKSGKPFVMAVLGAVIQGLKGFRYDGEWVNGDEIILLFEGTLDDKELRGIDRIRLNEAGQMVELEVFVRPLNSLTALAEYMGGALKQMLKS